MRILVVTEDYAGRLFGGIPRVLTETCRRLVARGDEVVVLTPRLPADLPARETIDGVDVARYACSDAGGIARLWTSCFASRRLATSLAEERPFDVVHTHFYLSAVGALDSPRLRNTRTIGTFYGPAREEFLEECGNARSARIVMEAWLRGTLQRRILMRSNGLVVLSQYSAEQLAEFLPRRMADAVVEIAAGVNTDRFSPSHTPSEAREMLCLPQDASVLLTVRRLIRRNGLDRLVAAMPEIVRQIPNALLVIVGKGEVREELEAQAQSLGMVEHMRFAGFVPDDDLPTYYCAADLSIMPTRALEGFGLPILESMACGTPVLGSAVGAIPEIIGGFDPDLLIPNIEPSTIAAGVIRALEACGGDPYIRRKCREYACENYSWDKHVDRLRELYRSC